MSRQGGVKELTADQLSRLLNIRRAMDGLDRARNALAARMKNILQGRQESAPVARKSRPARGKKQKRKGSLKDAIVAVLGQAAKPLNISAIHKALVARHFATKSRNLRKIIGMRLYADRKRFHKIKPGCFTLRK